MLATFVDGMANSSSSFFSNKDLYESYRLIRKRRPLGIEEQRVQCCWLKSIVLALVGFANCEDVNLML